MSSILTVADSVDGIEDLCSIIIVDGMSISLLVADSVDGVEDLCSIPEKDDPCLVFLV